MKQQEQNITETKINPTNTFVGVDALVSWICARHSKTHNIGLFTDKPISKGQRIYFNAPEIPEAAYLLLNKVLGEKEKELFLTTDDKIYDIRNSLLRYMNHSNEPNIDWENGLYIYALRDILRGEELTINYGWDSYPWRRGHKFQLTE